MGVVFKGVFGLLIGNELLRYLLYCLLWVFNILLLKIRLLLVVMVVLNFRIIISFWVFVRKYFGLVFNMVMVLLVKKCLYDLFVFVILIFLLKLIRSCLVVLLNFILVILGVFVKIVRLVVLIFIRFLFIERDIEKWVEMLIVVI